MGWLLAEANEKWQTKHGPKIARREFLKKKLNGGEIAVKAEKIIQILAAQGNERQAIGKALEQVRRDIELLLPRISKYGAVFKSAEQKDRFIDWAQHQGWTQGPQESLWMQRWRHSQLLRRNGSRLNASAEDVAAWSQQADLGEFTLDDDDRGWEPANEVWNGNFSLPILGAKAQSSLCAPLGNHAFGAIFTDMGPSMVIRAYSSND